MKILTSRLTDKSNNYQILQTKKKTCNYTNGLEKKVYSFLKVNHHIKKHNYSFMCFKFHEMYHNFSKRM